MLFVARNVAKVELDSTSATVARNVLRKVAPCVRTFTPPWDASYPQHYIVGNHLYTWVDRNNMVQSFLCKETTRLVRPGFESLTFRLQVQCANHCTTTPPLNRGNE